MSRSSRLCCTGTFALLLAIPVKAQAQEPMAAGSPACDILVDSVPRSGSPVAFLHPSRVTNRYAEPIAGGRWLVVFGSLKADIDTAFASLVQRPGVTPNFQRAQVELRRAVDMIGRQLVPVIEAPLSERPARLVPLEISQFQPFQSPAGDAFIVLLRDDPAAGDPVRLVADSLRLSEYEGLCWASRSQSRLLSAFNFEAAPIGNATIDRLAREWQSYREKGPTQLPHELILNRALRAVFVKSRQQRYHPSRFDLVALHPFAAFEVARRGDGTLDRHESYAVELGGFTLWASGWTRHYGASWMVSYDPDGRVGWGPLVRVSGYFTTGLVFRRDSSGVRRKSLLVTVDLLRFLRLDAAEMALRQAKGVANALVDGAATRR